MRNAQTIADTAAPGDEWHVASFIVQHRADASGELDAGIARLPGLERFDGDATRSIVLCESSHSRALMDGIEALRAISGVINVSLVYHHVEPRADLDARIQEYPSPAPVGGTEP
ncbi:chaperone NapD [Marilutibacter alkalisoli]|uniref:Chaperone NapD n=1 Tax=Marilutibacter alkalisoli TaxID=2591633 RepID=A0A514BRM8_9GAMM|nr:chaperone NapD [Lysobacter alkalisoli]QDH70036.1 nitrate reductase formation protein NapD [Lysobacter alkalisoli]